jgi:6,7-dimethyl-8-ribityllumazine synthase
MNQSPPNQISAPRVAFVQARWHAEIVDRCRLAFVDELARLTNGGARVEILDVPGAFEIPLLARDLARTGRFDAVVGAAFVVDGGIYRHDFVAQAVVDGLMRVQLETGVPILSAVLTPHNFQESDAHRDFFLAHFMVKGREAAEACVSILRTRQAISQAA